MEFNKLLIFIFKEYKKIKKEIISTLRNELNIFNNFRQIKS